MSSASDKARQFLEESVFASRDLATPDAEASCGLGSGPVLLTDFSPRQQAALQALAPDLSQAGLQAVRDVANRWVRLQDGLDRKRNHFLKGFREEHGFTRSAYSPEVLEQYQTGLDAVNRENDERLEAMAQELLSVLA